MLEVLHVFLKLLLHQREQVSVFFCHVVVNVLEQLSKLGILPDYGEPCPAVAG